MSVNMRIAKAENSSISTTRILMMGFSFHRTRDKDLQAETKAPLLHVDTSRLLAPTKRQSLSPLLLLEDVHRAIRISQGLDHVSTLSTRTGIS